MQHLQSKENSAQGKVDEAPDPEDVAAQVSRAHAYLHPAASLTEWGDALHGRLGH